ncbi:tyrosine-type recombinase/integrase [Bacillus salacetis]|uniref:tyrosine-type recombinase/integrase n=1 Tax=Bacillus salacetis TaxID=2315464 RepID=UPI003BA26279
MGQSPNNLIEKFTVWLEKEGKSANTVTTYERELKKYQDWLQSKGKTLNDFSRMEVQKYIHFLEDQGRSPVTTDKILGVIRTYSKFLKKPELTSEINIITVEKKAEIETLNESQRNDLLKKVKEESNNRNVAIVYTLLHTGIRVSELCSLDKSDVDLENSVITVKSPTGDQRTIPLSDEARHHLKKYIETSQVQEALFVSRAQERLTERSIQYMLKKFDVHPHKLRHTFCQQLVDKGVSIEIVSRLAGHKDINVTKRYSKSRIEQLALEEAIHKTFMKDH